MVGVGVVAASAAALAGVIFYVRRRQVRNDRKWFHDQEAEQEAIGNLVPRALLVERGFRPFPGSTLQWLQERDGAELEYSADYSEEAGRPVHNLRLKVQVRGSEDLANQYRMSVESRQPGPIYTQTWHSQREAQAPVGLLLDWLEEPLRSIGAVGLELTREYPQLELHLRFASGDANAEAAQLDRALALLQAIRDRV
jgi:hypothetical protein